jgi:hypothetical protein
MPPAVIAAGVVAAGTIGGAAIASSGQKKAANQAANAQTQATNTELQLGQQNLAQQRDIYNQNKALLTPFVSRGNDAGSAINALLGLSPAQSGVQSAPVAGQTPVMSQEDWANGALNAMGLGSRGDSVASLQQNLAGQHEGPLSPQMMAAYNQYVSAHPQASAQPATQQAAPSANPTSALDAFNNFANSAGMQFQLQQGERALNNGYAARGELKSGDAMKALQSYGQNTALNNYFMPYLSLLQGQQATGAQSGAAVAGVGSNFGNTVSNVFGGMQNAVGNGADAISNAALLRGQANAGLGNSIGSALGNFAGTIFNPGLGSSYSNPAINVSPTGTNNYFARQPGMF